MLSTNACVSSFSADACEAEVVEAVAEAAAKVAEVVASKAFVVAVTAAASAAICASVTWDTEASLVASPAPPTPR